MFQCSANPKGLIPLTTDQQWLLLGIVFLLFAIYQVWELHQTVRRHERAVALFKKVIEEESKNAQ